MSKSVRKALILVCALVVLGTAAIPIRTYFLGGGQIQAAGDNTAGSTNSFKKSTTKPATTDASETETDEPTTQEESQYSSDQSVTRGSSGNTYNNNTNTTAPPNTTKPVVPSTNKNTTTTKASATTTGSNGFGEGNLIEGGDVARGKSMLSYKMDPEEGYFYTEEKAWQREFGFNIFYDKMSPYILFFYDTVRVEFTYQDYDWMIQLWKGQYGMIMLGAEIGVYFKPEGRSTGGEIDHYDCADDEHMLPMEMRMYNKGEVSFRRPYQKYWWVTGFISGSLDKANDRSQLVVEARITFKDTTMAAMFYNGMLDHGFIKAKKLNLGTTTDYICEADSIYRNGKDVFFVWQTMKDKI